MCKYWYEKKVIYLYATPSAMRTAILFILLNACISYCYGQDIQLTANYVGQSSLSLDRLWQGNIVNLSNYSKRVWFGLEISSGKLLSKAKSKELNLPTGSTSLSSLEIQLERLQFFDQELETIVKALGGFPQSSFQVCLTVNVVNEAPISIEDCGEIEVFNPLPLLLAYPYDEDTLGVVNPMFSWIPPVVPGFLSCMKYQINLFENTSSVSSYENARRKLPIHNYSDIDLPNYLYPVDAHPIKEGYSYSWQVRAYCGKYTLAISDVWKFYIGTESLENDSLIPREVSYLDLLKFDDKREYFAIDGFKWRLLNESNPQQITMKIYALDGKKSICSINDTIQSGDNFKFTSFDICKLKHKRKYMLEIYNKNRNQVIAFVRFRYIKADLLPKK